MKKPFYESRTDFLMRREAWFKAALDVVTGICKEKAVGDYINVNDYRTKVTALCGEPLHHNHWGALTRMAMRQKIIDVTNEVCSAKHKAAHGHKVRVYTVVKGQGIPA